MLDARFRAFVARLACPDCRSALAFTPAPAPPTARASFGVLRCPCAAYPVIDGVPILTRGEVAVRSIADARVVGAGPTAAALVRLIEAGQGEAALVSLLAFPVCLWPLGAMSAGRALAGAGPVRALGLAARRRTLRAWLRRRDALAAEDWLDLFYWRSPAIYDPFNYFLFRFAQPRHLATLALAPALPPDVPLLDLACGSGHLLHSLTAAHPQRVAVGVDQNFHQVWLARHWIAPAADFAVADADRPLPFADGSFGVAVCVDAFHYVLDKAACVAELGRVTDDGTLVLARVGNRAAEPNEGDELTPEGYAALFGERPVRAFDERSLAESYLAGFSPDLRPEVPLAGVAASKWLYLVSAASVEAFPPARALAQPDGVPPHAAGCLALNPVYDVQRRGAGLALRFCFPSPWFAFENAAMADYHAPKATVDAADLTSLSLGERSEQVRTLANHYVILGLPVNYARLSGRPWPLRANRALRTVLGRLTRGA